MTAHLKRGLLALLAALCFCTASAEEPGREKLDAYFEALAAANKFMGSVAVSKDGKEIYSISVGFADTELKIPAGNRSIYRIGSISKTFTAVLVFQAVEAGKLSLDTPVGSYFPRLENGGDITVEALLRHRSGIPNFTAGASYAQWATEHRSREQMVETIVRAGSGFAPGSRMEYSNSNYVLLSFILETVYDRPYAEILDRQIVRPLALADTYIGKGTVSTAENECNSYKYFDKWRIESVTDPSIPLGAGAVVSTPADLNRFAEALFGGKLISRESLSAMQLMRDGYGMGLFETPFYTKTGYGHSGGIDGFNAMLAYFPEERLSYAIVSNGLNYHFNDIHIAVLSWAYGKPFDVPDFRNTNLRPEELDAYTGVYSCDQFPLKITVTRNGDALTAQGTGQPPFPLEAAAKDRFRFAQAGIVMEFDPQKNTMILHQGGGTFYFKKE